MAEMEPKKTNAVSYRWIHSVMQGTSTGSAMRMATVGGHVVSYVVAPLAGSVIGLSGYVEDLVGTGSLTVKPLLGLATTSAASIYWKAATASHTRGVYSAFARGDYAFAAGTVLGMSYTSTNYKATASSAITVEMLVHYEQN